LPSHDAFQVAGLREAVRRGFTMPVASSLELLDHRALPELASAVDRFVGRAGVDVEYAGLAPLLTEPQLYRPEPAGTYWALFPAETDPGLHRGDLPIPPRERRRLNRIRRRTKADLALYVGHELDPADVEKALPGLDAGLPIPLTPDAAAALVPQPKPHRAAVDGAARLGEALGTAAQGVARVAPWLIAAAAVPVALAVSPLLLVGAAMAGLDPVVVGALSAGGSRTPGVPAAYFVLARWTD
jgi:hypothetical protein